MQMGAEAFHLVLGDMLLLGVNSIIVSSTFQDEYWDESLQSLKVLESVGDCFELPLFRQGIFES